MSDGSINNDKVKEILAQLRAAYASNDESDTAMDPHAYTGEEESANVPTLLEEREETHAAAPNEDTADAEETEESAPRAEKAEEAEDLPKERPDETPRAEQEELFSIPVEELSADKAEELPFKPEKELSEKSNYYQFSILGDDTDLFPQVKHEESGLDGFESFIVRPTKSNSADSENEIHRHVDETITLTEEERFDPIRWEQMRAAEEARLKAEEEARLKAEEEARLKAEEEARLKAEEEARLKAEEEARLKAEEEARLKAEEEARLKAEEEARLKAEEEARLKAEEEAKEKAQADAVTQKAEDQEGEAASYNTLSPETAETVERFALLLRRAAEKQDEAPILATHAESTESTENTENTEDVPEGEAETAEPSADGRDGQSAPEPAGNDGDIPAVSDEARPETSSEEKEETPIPKNGYADDSCCSDGEPALREDSPLEGSPVSDSDEGNDADVLPEPPLGAAVDGYAENDPDPESPANELNGSDGDAAPASSKEEGDEEAPHAEPPPKSGSTSRRILTASKEERAVVHSPRIRYAPDAYRQVPSSDEKKEQELAEKAANEKKKKTVSRVVVAPQGGEEQTPENGEFAQGVGEASCAEQPEKSEKTEKNEEEFVYTIPENLYDRIGKHPLGTAPYGGNPPPERIRNAEDKETEAALAEQGEEDEKRLYALFPEEQQDELTSRERIDSFRTRLQRTARYSRIKLMFASVFALLLLILESAKLVFDGLPDLFTDPVSVGYLSVILLLGVFVSSISCMKIGLHGILYKRIVPESIILVETVATIFYTFVFAVIGIDVAHFGFVSALAVVFMLFYRTVHTESRYSSFRFITANGYKLVYAPMANREKRAELNAIGKSIDEENAAIYRLRRTPFVDEFTARTTKVCEDERINLAILLISILCAAVSAVVHYYINEIPEQAAAAGLYVLLFAVPVAMCSSHFYAMHRVLAAAGSDSTVLGEKTVLECGKVEAIAFEDVEAFPEGSITLENLNICTSGVDTALYYFCSLLHELGGPLFAFVRPSLPRPDRYGEVRMREITKDGVYAEVDSAALLLGNHAYMESKGIKPEVDANLAALLSDGKVSVLYVAVNGVIALEYALTYNVSPLFEENVRRLNKKGISAIIRTFDPSLDDAMLMRISSLGDCRVHVVHKGLKQVNDFAADRVAAGLVTNTDAPKLLRMFFMCLGARRVLLVQKVLKLICMIAGAALGVTSVFLFSAHVSMPSALIALFHLLWVLLSVSVSRFGIRLSGKKEKKAKGKQNGTRKDIKHS